MFQIKCRCQYGYPYGQMMCTSASVCVGVSVLAGKVRPLTDNSGKVRSGVHVAMALASRVQQGVEAGLAGGTSAISVADMERYGGLDLKRVGVSSEEFVIVPAMGKTRMVYSNDQRLPRKMTPDSCIVSCEALVDCMIHKDKREPIVAVLTNNGHSICAMCQDHQFCVFNPGDGVFMIGIGEHEFRSMMLDYASDPGDPAFQVDVTILYCEL